MKLIKITALFLTVMLIVFPFAGCAKNDDAIDSPSEKLSYEEGTSSRDDIVNTSAADKVLLVVSFGTSFNESRYLTIGGIEAALAKAYPDYQIRRAFTAQIIIDKLEKRDGLKIDSVTQAMDRLVLDGVKEVVIQPTTVMNGFEYDDIIDEVMPYADKFESLKIGKWLLADDSDFDEVVESLVKETQKFRADGTAIVLMGHGTEHESGAIYTKIQSVFKSKGYDDYVIGTVEHTIELGEVQKILAGMGVKKVVLRPLMIVAGDHANNDMADPEDEESWYAVLTEDGYEVSAVLEGLGQIKGIQDIFIKHVQNALSSESLSVTPAEIAGITAGRVKNDTYSIKAGANSAMFKIVDCRLTVEDDRMTAVMTLSGTGYGKVFMGTVQGLIENDAVDFTLANDGKHSFSVPVSALDKNLDCAALGVKSGTWYDHVVVFESDNIPDDAFLPCQIEVKMEGGSGKASIQSPAQLTYKDGGDYAEIIWSSPNYAYMIVDGAEYLPINTEGNSTFIIPVILDKDMKVTACTTAMSAPKEIEYVLHFDSASIK
jgi:sirohydrochlorin cobaltochelatase